MTVTRYLRPTDYLHHVPAFAFFQTVQVYKHSMSSKTSEGAIEMFRLSA